MLIACENIDRLQCLEIQGRGLPRGVKWRLYEAARAISDKPLVMAAADMLDCKPARIGIVSGAAVPDHMPNGENDGPFGSVVLAEALVRIGHDVRIYTDPDAAEPFRALLDRRPVDVAVNELNLNDKTQQEAIAQDLDIAIAIERLGGNVNGITYGATGVSRESFRCNVDHLFETMTRSGKPTLSIGDGGNEIGFGKVRESLVETMPDLNKADLTPCGGGIVSAVATDVLVVATSSNLGAYGVCAALAVRRGDKTLCHTPDEEVALEYIGVGLGLTDGGTGERIAAVDGIPLHDNVAVVTLMQALVERALAKDVERG
ncbi:MAG: glutamate cyclase domain-containing protein, partial [Pseudomonadota bacterium]